MTYREELTRAMDALALANRACFVGYGLRVGRAMGTLKNVADDQIIETPVAENLMTGIAIGLSLKGRLPLVFFERFDFALNAADAIVNHLHAAKKISSGEFAPAVILRCVVGNKTKPLFTGETHTQDFSEAFASMGLNVCQLRDPEQITQVYRMAREAQLEGVSTMVVEYKDLL